MISAAIRAGSRQGFCPLPTNRASLVKWKSSVVVVGSVPSTTKPGPRSLVWPALFTIGFTGCCFGVASISDYHSIYVHRVQRFKSAPSWARNAFAELPPWVRNSYAGLERMGPAMPLLVPLMAANVGVWGCWKILGRNSAFMNRYFTHTPGQGRALPMVLSTFSHIGGIHLAANMVALYSFGSVVVQGMGIGLTTAFYLSSGVAAQFASASFSVLSSKRPIRPSVGASGGVLGLVSIFAFLCPEHQMYLLFFPFATFTAKKGLIGMALLDSVGLVRGWQIIDHAAHVGGLGLGLAFIHDLHKGEKGHFVNYYCRTMWWYHDLIEKTEARTKATEKR